MSKCTNSNLPIKRFFMIRHGQTVANAEGYAAGAFDTPLTEKGRDQAKSLKPLLSSLEDRPEVVMHSTLSRAKDTACILNEVLELPIFEAKGIEERDFGDWMGQPFKDVFDRVQNGEIPPNGEGNKTFVDRAIKGLTQILEKHQCPLVVTHGGMFDAIADVFGFIIEDIKNCQLYEFVPHPDDTNFPWLIKHYVLGNNDAVEVSEANYLLSCRA